MRRALVVFVLCATWVAAQDDPTIVEVADQGRVVGSRVADGDLEYIKFLGVPYAGSTKGSHRFKAPTAPSVFEGDFIADRENVKCVRPTENGYEGTEDCLVANIYVPDTATDGVDLPVIVWIEGSEFRDGDHLLSFKHILEQEVIVVALNYRESIFGFLCLGVEQAPGNAGLKDIIAGLRWIQKNIQAFRGNPNSVTLLGHGSGAAAVDLITLSPLSEGLIHKAIAQSGSSSAPWAISYDPRANAIAVAEKLGHVVKDEQSIADAFEKSSIGVLIAAMKDLEFTNNALAFAPCVENPELEEEEPLFTEPPYKIIVEGKYNQIPYITGYVQNEGTIRADETTISDWLPKMELQFEQFLQQDLKFESEDERQEKADEIRDEYFQGRSIDMTSIADYVKYHGDTMILVSTIRNARLRAENSEEPVYLYQFSYEGELDEPFVGPLSLEGAAHGEDLAYLFDTGITTDPSSTDTLVRNSMVRRWTNFAKTGIPRFEYEAVTSDLWIPVTADTVNYLHFTNNDVNVEQFELALVNPQGARMIFWDNIYANHYKEVPDVWDVDSRDEDDDDDETTPSPEDEETEPDDEEEEEEEEDDDDDDDGSPDNATRHVGLLMSVLASSLLVISLY